MYTLFGFEFHSENDLKPRLVRNDFFKLTQWVVFLMEAVEEEGPKHGAVVEGSVPFSILALSLQKLLGMESKDPGRVPAK